MSKLLRNVLAGAGIATVGAIGTKLAVDYFRNKDKEEAPPESEPDQAPQSDEEVSYAVVKDDSLQQFLDVSFGDPGRYVPTRPPKVFEYQGRQYMVVWARDNKQDKNQMLAFIYTPDGSERKMVASVGYTPEKTDYNLKLSETPFAVAVNGKKLTAGQGEMDGTKEVDFVLA